MTLQRALRFHILTLFFSARTLISWASPKSVRRITSTKDDISTSSEKRHDWDAMNNHDGRLCTLTPAQSSYYRYLPMMTSCPFMHSPSPSELHSRYLLKYRSANGSCSSRPPARQSDPSAKVQETNRKRSKQVSAGTMCTPTDLRSLPERIGIVDDRCSSGRLWKFGPAVRGGLGLGFCQAAPLCATRTHFGWFEVGPRRPSPRLCLCQNRSRAAGVGRTCPSLVS